MSWGEKMKLGQPVMTQLDDSALYVNNNYMYIV